MKIDKNTKTLYQAILLIKSETECSKFFRDLLTESEIKEFANRFKVATLLDQKIEYESIVKATGMSSTTIARISKWLHNGMGGYKLIIKRFNTQNKNHHTPTLVAV